MTQVRFYHLTRGTLEDALPVMLDRTIGRDQRRAVGMAGSAERVEALNRHLWVYDDRSFLAHGSAAEGYEKDQPIWLTDRDENPNGAEVLFLTDGATSEHIAGYALVCELFDGNDADMVARARARWRQYKDQGLAPVYYQQNERGSWEQKNDA